MNEKKEDRVIRRTDAVKRGKNSSKDKGEDLGRKGKSETSTRCVLSGKQ